MIHIGLIVLAASRAEVRFEPAVFLLQLDSTVCKEMSVSDTEVSDVTWTDNGTFNLSEGHTPQTENSDGTFAASAAVI